MLILDLIEKIGEVNSSVGRKPTLLKLKTGTPVVMGIDVAAQKTTIAAADLAGNILQKETSLTSPDICFITKQIIEKVSYMATKLQEKKSKADTLPNFGI